jgi:phosphatidylserine/phosphatidylglycerophosphate/cardiolipin synthase-like enzyme
VADVVVYASCSVLDVRVSFGTRASLSPLEQSVLRAVAAGVNDVAGLCDLLGLSSRMMYDVLGDLWRAEHLTLDSLNEAVHVTSQTAEMIANGTLDSQPGAEVIDEERQLLLDTVSGLLMPISAGRRRPGDRKLTVPEHDGEAQPAGLRPESLTEVMTRVLNDDQVAGAAPTEGDRKRIIRAYLTPSRIKQNSQRNYRPIAVRASIDPQDQLVVRVADESLPRRHQEEAQARLTRLIEDQPTSSFVTELRRYADGPPQEPETLATVLAEFTEHTAALQGVSPGDRERADGRVRGISRRITARIGLLAEQESALTLLSDHAAHDEAIHDLIRSARTQVVLACPWVTYPGLSTYTAALEDAAARGVQLVLLWGIGRTDEPDPAIREAVNSLRRKSRSEDGAQVRVLVSPGTSTVSHAKIVICDDAAAVVTSLNFLAPSNRATNELGVRLDAVDGRRNPAIGELLRWAADAMPDYVVAQSIITDQGTFQPPPQIAGHGPEPAPLLEDDPPLTPTASVDELGGPAVTAWAAAWAKRAQMLSAATDRRRPSVRLIRDGEHRDMLWSALSTATRNLLITSDKLADDVVDQTFLDQVEERVRRGVDVTLVYRRAMREGSERAVDRLTALAAKLDGAAGRLRLIRTDNHAKVLVVDDEAVVTSFNFLSFEGYYGGVGRRRQRAEVGARIFGRGFAAHLLATFGIEVTEPAPASGNDRQSVVALAVAQQLLDRLSDPAAHATATQLADLASSGGDPLAALTALRSCGATVQQLEPAVAAVLSCCEFSDDRVRGWWLWLARNRFEHQDFGTAAALRADLPDDGAQPRAALLRVGAELRMAELGSTLTDAVLQEGLTAAEWHALLAVGTHGLLAAGDSELREAVAVALTGARPPWVQLAEIAIGWWDEALRPLPMDRIKRAEHRHQATRRASRQWAELLKSLHAFGRFSPGYMSGVGTQKFLTRTGGPLNLLLLAAQSRDQSAVRAWLDDPDLQDIGRWVDDATRAAGISKLIIGHLRPPFIARVEAIVAAATAAARDDAGAGSAFEAFDDTVDLAGATVAALRRALPPVSAAVPGLTLPERVLAAQAVRDLELLIEEEQDEPNRG